MHVIRIDGIYLLMKHTKSLPCTENNTYKGVEADVCFVLLKSFPPYFPYL